MLAQLGGVTCANSWDRPMKWSCNWWCCVVLNWLWRNRCRVWVQTLMTCEKAVLGLRLAAITDSCYRHSGLARKPRWA
jgi:hypothetical protein